MVIIAYATSEKDLDYLLKNVPAHKYFRDHIDRGEKRAEWSSVLLHVQKNKNKEDVLVKIPSLASLRAENKAKFDTLIGDVIKHNGAVLSVQENIIFNREHPQGLAAEEGKLEEVMNKLQRNWNRGPSSEKPGIEIVNRNKPGIEIVNRESKIGRTSNPLEEAKARALKGIPVKRKTSYEI